MKMAATLHPAAKFSFRPPLTSGGRKANPPPLHLVRGGHERTCWPRLVFVNVECLNAADKLQPQRNYVLTKITNPNTFLYYLDDDNILHPNLYKLLNVIDYDKMYSFNQ